jgi:hypothetical protein
MVVLGRFFSSTLVRMYLSGVAENHALASDQMIHLLRHDVWNATSIQTSDPATVVLRHDNSIIATWRLSGTTVLRESSSQSPRTWDVSDQPKFIPERDGIAVQFAGTAPIQLVSQMLVEQGGVQ